MGYTKETRSFQTGSPRFALVDHYETFTHRQELPDARVIYANPVERMYRLDGKTTATPPAEWDASKAIEKPARVCTWTEERDYS
jgi:hypothetical protein